MALTNAASIALTSAGAVAQSSLAAVSAEAAVVSRNIAGVNATGTYNEKTANLVTSLNGGVQVASITRAQNQALFDGVLSATSASATQTAISSGLATLQLTVGYTNSDTSPASQLSDFIDALQTYEATPSSTSLAASTVTAAQNLANTLNSATTSVEQVREQADAGIAASVGTINSLLSQFQSVNAQIVQGTAVNADVTDLEDTRDTILTQLSQQIGISTTAAPQNGISIYTDSGITLFQGGTARSVTFQPTGTFVSGTQGNAVFIDGVPATGSSATTPLQSGTLAGLATLRDSTAVTYQNQLDQVANGLINATSETFTPAGGTTSVTAPGLFTFAGASGTPPALPTSATGLGGLIEVNPAVDPNQNGNPDLIRDGINTTFNPGGDASFAGQLENLLTNLNANQTFSSSGQIATSNTLSGYAADSVSWLEAQRQQNSNESSFQSTLLTSTTSALSNATGVSLDNELSKMLDLEQSYSASAQLMSTVNSMFTSLLTAVQTITGNAG
jgi:flagellar hook-associated protein 1